MMEATAAESRRDEEERRIDDQNEEMQVQWEIEREKKSCQGSELSHAGPGPGPAIF